MADRTTLDAMEETVKKLEQTADEHSQWLDDHQQTLGTLNSMLTTLDAKFDQYIALLIDKFGALPSTALISSTVTTTPSTPSSATTPTTPPNFAHEIAPTIPPISSVSSPITTIMGPQVFSPTIVTSEDHTSCNDVVMKFDKDTLGQMINDEISSTSSGNEQRKPIISNSNILWIEHFNNQFLGTNDMKQGSNVNISDGTFFFFIEYYAKFKFYNETIRILDVMEKEFGFKPGTFSYSLWLNVLVDGNKLKVVEDMHSMMLSKLFDEMPKRELVSWNVLIPGLDPDILVGNALLKMYIDCGSIEDYSMTDNSSAKHMLIEKQGCLLVRQSLFHNEAKNFANVGGGVLGCRGFHSSFRTIQGGLSLNIDISTSMIIQPRPVVDFFIANQNVKDPFSIDWVKAKRILKNLRVKTRPTKQEYKIIGLSEKPCREHPQKQKLKDENGEAQTTEVTVYEYVVNNRNSMSLESIEQQATTCENRKYGTVNDNIVEESSQSSPKKKRKKMPNANDGDGCKRCNCKKTKCLKLYCDCFAAGIYCAEPCACQVCFNRPEYEDTILETRQQIESRNPLAFAPKVI